MIIFLFLLLLFLFLIFIPSPQEKFFLLGQLKKIYFLIVVFLASFLFLIINKNGHTNGKYIPAHFESGVLVQEQIKK